jgi:5-methylcytosine-specific restriction endonuclease McrA
MKKAGLSHLEQRILELLRTSPLGLDIIQIRKSLGIEDTQQHLDRRVRALDPFYVIERERKGQRLLYRFVRPRVQGEWDYFEIPKQIRAKLLLAAGGKCQMCGRTVKDDSIKLHIDHKIPREWGGKTEEDNLWAICSVCNEGKKNYYASFDTGIMRNVLVYPSVHKRIAELLHIMPGEWVDCDIIEFVANSQGFQTDWRKRLRELRYLGLEIETMRDHKGRRTISLYRLRRWVPLPDDPTAAARKYEKDRAKTKVD